MSNRCLINNSSKIKITVPKGDKFIHCCYKECARVFFENPTLVEDRMDRITRMEQSKNLQKAYKLIMTSIENTIRNLLPIESLLREQVSLKETGNESEYNPFQNPQHEQHGQHDRHEESREESRESREPREPRESRESIEPRESREPRETRGSSREHHVSEYITPPPSSPPMALAPSLVLPDYFKKDTKDTKESEFDPNETTKTIFLGNFTHGTKKSTQLEASSDDSEGDSERFKTDNDIPMLKHKDAQEKLNLYVSNDQLNLDSGNNNGNHGNTELPSLKFPSESFFSDLE